MQGNNPSQSGGPQGSNTNNRPAGLSWSQPQTAKPITPPLIPASRPVVPSVSKVQQAPPSGRGKLIILFLVGVVVGGALTWGWYTLQTPASSVTKNTNTNTGTNTNTNSATPTGSTGIIGGSTTIAPTTPVASSDSLSVPSPQDAGLTVTVISAPVTQPTWIVVYDSIDGERGNALGAKLFFPTSKDTSINLLRTTKAGTTYLVGKRVDNGDGQFSMTLDQPVLNAAGNPLYVEFKTR